MQLNDDDDNDVVDDYDDDDDDDLYDDESSSISDAAAPQFDWSGRLERISRNCQGQLSIMATTAIMDHRQKSRFHSEGNLTENKMKTCSGGLVSGVKGFRGAVTLISSLADKSIQGWF